MAPDIAAYLQQHESKGLLRFITCGSVDDGKSTLIGRLLHDTKLLLDDQVAALEADSRRHGTQGGELDFALLVDGLAAEREQGITIDVAYRFFGTERRKFIVADCPGHEQYTRNMATGASTADLAVVLVDARKGLLTQTRRHSYIASLLGIRHVLLAVNKMDLVDYRQDVFDSIVAGYRDLATQLGIANVQAIPLSALRGDNMVDGSAAMPWYRGPSLLQHLETVQVEPATQATGFRLPVQWVNRPNQDFRGWPDSNARRSGLPAPSRCCWPITSSGVCGRSCSASGAPASGPALANRSLIPLIPKPAKTLRRAPRQRYRLPLPAKPPSARALRAKPKQYRAG